MNFVEFNEHCKRTRPESDLLVWRHHYTLGIFEELGEISGAVKRHAFYNQPLDVENIKEEIGDFLWYFMGLLFDDEWSTPEVIGIAEDTKYQKSLVTDLLKEQGIHDELDLTTLVSMLTGTVGAYIMGLDDFASYAMAVLGNLGQIASTLGTTLEECMELNVKKLAKRYPNGYTDEHAAMRLDKQEESE
jgi:hypothetical protein